VTRIYTDLAVFDISDDGLVVRDLFGTDLAWLRRRLDVPVHDGT
jgi:hypothetical protein